MTSKILYCHTDGAEFVENQYDIARIYQESALFRTKPDILGLRAWDEHKDKIDFSQYELVWIHLNPTELSVPWYMFISFLRKRCPNAILIGKHEWWEKYYQEEMPEVLIRYMNKCDYIHVNTGMGKQTVETYLSPPPLYYHIGNPMPREYKYPTPLPWDERDGIVTIMHSSHDPMIRKMEMAKRTGLPLTVINSEPFSDGRLGMLADAVGGDITFHERLEWDEYLDVISRHKIAFDFDYRGICRFAYEAAKVKVPVVGSDLCEYRNLLYPDLTIGPFIDQPWSILGPQMVQKIQEIHDGPDPKHLNSYAYQIVRRHWSKKACKARLLEMFDEIGFEYP